MVKIPVDSLNNYRCPTGSSDRPRVFSQEIIDIFKEAGVSELLVEDFEDIDIDTGEIYYFSVPRLDPQVVRRICNTCESLGMSIRSENYGISPNERTGFEAE